MFFVKKEKSTIFSFPNKENIVKIVKTNRQLTTKKSFDEWLKYALKVKINRKHEIKNKSFFLWGNLNRKDLIPIDTIMKRTGKAIKNKR